MTPPDPPWTDDDAEWPVREEVVAWETPFCEAGYDVVERPDGTEGEYYWLASADAAAAVAVTDDDELVLVEQYRPRYRRRSLGLPAGFVEDGEDPEAAAARELREETGFVADDLSHLETHTLSPWTRYVRHLYVATGLDRGERDLDDGEYVDVETVPADEAVDRLRGREGVSEGITLTGLLLAREEGLL
ncbi:NUDIX hydrolase [Halosimplex halophilum]|uniref:NUDIX hydrolase n=1 Tax=Halosimplex halophilum TaxID=2559572 RepID=UPI00107F5F79|nr:NUDIX hydrolase [Halosimplex halophilum]